MPLPAPTNLDPNAVALTRAIRINETGNSGDIPGKSGELPSRYQFMPDTWKALAGKYLSDPNAQLTPENQNYVAYHQVKELKDKGYAPDQILSIWNHGSPEYEGAVGVNGKGIEYNVPAYVKSGLEHFKSEAMKIGGEFDTQTANATQAQNGKFVNPSNTQISPRSNSGNFVTPPQVSSMPVDPYSSVAPSGTREGLGDQLLNRTHDLTQAVSDTATGRINPLSGVIQSAGAVAGSLGDVVNKGIELIPGVKRIENLIGKGLGSLAKTAVGQSVIKSVTSFSKAHPELSKDIGAGFNIITAIPILKGLGAVKNVALDAVATTLKDVAEKGALKDLTEVASRTVGGRAILAKEGEGLIKEGIIDPRFLPDIQKGRYFTQGAYEKMGKAISNIEENELQPTLAKVSTTQVADRQSLESLRQEALNSVKADLKGTGNSLQAAKEIDNRFDSFRNDYGDYVTLQDINDMKRGVRRSVNFNSPKLESDVTYHLGQFFQNNIEQMADKLGLADVKLINRKMAKLIKAQQLLKYIEARPVKTGLMGDIIKTVATAGGEMAGNATGIPFAGAYGAYRGGSLASRTFPKSIITKEILERTGTGVVKRPLGYTRNKIGGLLGAALADKAARK